MRTSYLNRRSFGIWDWATWTSCWVHFSLSQFPARWASCHFPCPGFSSRSASTVGAFAKVGSCCAWPPPCGGHAEVVSARLNLRNGTIDVGKWKWSHSVMSDSSRPHGLQPTRLLRDFPGKSTGVGCHCLLPSQIGRYFCQMIILSAGKGKVKWFSSLHFIDVGGVSNVLGSVSSQQKFEVTDGPVLQLCVTAQFYLESKGKYILRVWGHADPKDTKIRGSPAQFWLLFLCFFSSPWACPM